MSQTREVAIEAANKEVVTEGAIAYGLTVDAESVRIGGQNIKITDNGTLVGDFYGVKKLGSVNLDAAEQHTGEAAEQPIAEEVLGRFVQAGSVRTIEQNLKQNGYAVTANAIQGHLRAQRQQEVVNVEVSRDGKLSADLDGFKGNACSLTIESFLQRLGSFKNLKQEKKTEPQQVMRTTHT